MHDPADRDLARWFALDDAPGPARPVDDARAAAIIAGALGGAGFPPPGGGGGAGGAGAKPIATGVVDKAAKGAAGKTVAGAKLAVLAGGTVTAIAAVVWLALRTPHEAPAPIAAVPAQAVARGSAVPEAQPPVVARAPDETAARPPDDATARPPDATTPAAVDPAGEAAAPAGAADAPITAPARRPAHHAPARPGSHRKPHAPRAEPPAVAVAATAAEPTTPGTPDDLLAEANAARAAHRWRDADALYARVVGKSHADLAGQTALVASGTLHLEHLGDPAGAARRFRAALASALRDTLAEDARWGLVESARALGQATGELSALDDFLAHHPGSARVPRARARRLELGAAP